MALCSWCSDRGNFSLEIAWCSRVVDALYLDSVVGSFLEVVRKLEHLDKIASKSRLESHRALRAWLKSLEEELVFEGSEDGIIQSEIALLVFARNQWSVVDLESSL